MGKLIIDGNSVFEIDEECMKRRRPSPECDVEKYMQTERLEFLKDSQSDSYEKAQRYK